MLRKLIQKCQFFIKYLLYIYVRYKERREQIMLASSGQAFGTMVKPSRRGRSAKVQEFRYLEKKDRRMRFNNSQDPIYSVFDCIEDRPLKVLAKEFVKDSFFEAVNFVSKVVG